MYSKINHLLFKVFDKHRETAVRDATIKFAVNMFAIRFRRYLRRKAATKQDRE